MNDIPLLVRVALGIMGAAMLIATVCRFQFMSRSGTLARVRAAALAQFAAALLAIVAATIRPDWVLLSAVVAPAASVAWSAATAHAWRSRLPLSMTVGSAVIRQIRPAPGSWSDTVPLKPRRVRAGGSQ